MSTPSPTPPATIADWLGQAARQRGNAAAYIDADRSHGWAEVDAASDRMACGLMGLGLQRGDRIGVLALNQIEWLWLFYAAAKIGVAVVALSVRYRDNELATMLSDSQTRAVFTLAGHEGFDFIAMFARLGPQLPALRHVIAIGGIGLNSLDALAATPLEAGRLSAARRRVSAQDVAMVIYTSGTTGRPKGAGLTHLSLLASAAAQAAHTRVGDADLIHLANPLNHVGGITCGVLTHLVGGGTIVLVPEFKADRLVTLMQQHRPTIVAGVPTMLTLLLMNPRVDRVDFSAVRLVFSGGSNVDAVLLERLGRQMPNATLMNLYGLTETSGAIVMTPWERTAEDLMTTIGLPFAGAQLRIAGPNGEALPPGAVGELWFKGVGVVPGYIGAAAGAGFSADGWLQTGDLGLVAARGVITLKGRKKDMYIQGGFNVYPAEVEALINRHPQVVMAAVIGMPDPVMGEIGRAYVIARPGSGLNEAELRRWCAEHLADYKVPRQVLLREALPMTPAGKIHKAALRDELAGEAPAGVIAGG
ncbi:MAG: AMP-binding protein [Burkholderiaceae bacterium]|nr:AMP-binding protein [Burkholderiaceae bacterium]